MYLIRKKALQKEEEAKQKASVINPKIEDAYNIYLNDQEIVEIEDIGDLNKMIDKAGRNTNNIF